jgi:hypothetical protein
MPRPRVLLALCLPTAATLAALPAVLSVPACVRRPAASPAITSRFADSFDRAQLGADWAPTADAWSLRDGHVHAADARNHPLWLRRRLPRNARIEFDAWSDSPAGDIKCEVYGDGRSYATEIEYTATSYVVVFGGWFNRYDMIARMEEHGNTRRIRPSRHVVPGRRYRWVIERRGDQLTWQVDGEPMLEYVDGEPLAGPGHEYFAFNDWAAELGFDNLVITPL